VNWGTTGNFHAGYIYSDKTHEKSQTKTDLTNKSYNIHV